jgi:hypothetical protein
MKYMSIANRVRIRNQDGGAGAGATHERAPANEGGIVADHRPEYRGRSRTCPDATAGIFGRSHRLKLLRQLALLHQRGERVL